MENCAIIVAHDLEAIETANVTFRIRIRNFVILARKSLRNRIDGIEPDAPDSLYAV